MCHDTGCPIPLGLCHCGCGAQTTISNRTTPQWGWVKGEPRRFIAGHHNRLREPEPIADRFWRHVEKTGACWIWSGMCNDNGYGILSVGGHDSRMERAHRISWEIHNGPIPDGLWVLHKCDNPPCVRPDHLFLGTHQDNMDDAVNKGRMHTGEAHGLRLHPERTARGDAHWTRRHPERVVRGENHWTRRHTKP